MFKIKSLMTIVLSSLFIIGCSSKNDTEYNQLTDNDLCASKQQIVLNHTYYDSWKACERLTSQNDYHAEYILGLLYTDEKILSSFLNKDTRVSEGISHIKNAADHNIVEAARTLGEFYDNQGNNEEATKYLTNAANSNDIDAIISLATIYESNDNCQEASRLYKKEIALNKINAEGWLYLFLINYEGCKDLKANNDNACAYYSQVLNHPVKNTLLSLIKYEQANNIAAKQGSITRATKGVQDYYKKNQKSCLAAGNKINASLTAN